MIYLRRDTDIAAAEKEATAQRLEAKGWQRCTYAEWWDLWRWNDQQTALAQFGPASRLDQERAVGAMHTPLGWHRGEIR